MSLLKRIEVEGANAGAGAVSPDARKLLGSLAGVSETEHQLTDWQKAAMPIVDQAIKETGPNDPLITHFLRVKTFLGLAEGATGEPEIITVFSALNLLLDKKKRGTLAKDEQQQMEYWKSQVPICLDPQGAPGLTAAAEERLNAFLEKLDPITAQINLKPASKPELSQKGGEPEAKKAGIKITPEIQEIYERAVSQGEKAINDGELYQLIDCFGIEVFKGGVFETRVDKLLEEIGQYRQKIDDGQDLGEEELWRLGYINGANNLGPNLRGKWEDIERRRSQAEEALKAQSRASGPPVVTGPFVRVSPEDISPDPNAGGKAGDRGRGIDTPRWTQEAVDDIKNKGMLHSLSQLDLEEMINGGLLDVNTLTREEIQRFWGEYPAIDPGALGIPRPSAEPEPLTRSRKEELKTEFNTRAAQAIASLKALFSRIGNTRGVEATKNYAKRQIEACNEIIEVFRKDPNKALKALGLGAGVGLGTGAIAGVATGLTIAALTPFGWIATAGGIAVSGGVFALKKIAEKTIAKPWLEKKFTKWARETESIGSEADLASLSEELTSRIEADKRGYFRMFSLSQTVSYGITTAVVSNIVKGAILSKQAAESIMSGQTPAETQTPTSTPTLEDKAATPTASATPTPDHTPTPSTTPSHTPTPLVPEVIPTDTAKEAISGLWETKLDGKYLWSSCKEAVMEYAKANGVKIVELNPGVTNIDWVTDAFWKMIAQQTGGQVPADWVGKSMIELLGNDPDKLEWLMKGLFAGNREEGLKIYFEFIKNVLKK